MIETPKPYAAATTDYLGCEYISLDIEGIEKIAAAGSQGSMDVVYLYAGSPPPQSQMVGWAKVPDEPTLEFLKSINADNQVLAYENGRYYNAWFEFEPSEGGWLWTDEADSEPSPSHYRLLSEVALSAPEAEG